VQALAGVTAPYFFLSYAHKSRGDARDEGELDYWVGELFRDLCRSVRQRSGMPESLTPGFMDTDRRVGDDWPLGVIQALNNCSAFVPLYSGRYFADANCGKEWNFFTSRMSDPVEQEAAIVPAIWDPVEPGKLPQAARALPFRYRGSEAYEDLGLYAIMKVSRYRVQYDQVVRDLASSIVTAAELHPVKRGAVRDPHSLESSFGPAGAYRGLRGHMRVRITVVAPRRDELPDERRNSSRYGQSALDWNPYAVDPARRVAQEAAAVARSLGYVVEVGDLCQHEADLLSGDPRYGPQILIIDPWALLVPNTQQLLERVNDSHLPWVQALIPWDSADDDNQKWEGKLRTGLEATLPGKLAEAASISSMAAQGIPSADLFDDVLGLLVGAAVRRYLSSAAAYPPGGKTVVRPRLS
jgi:FxsC-like protein